MSLSDKEHDETVHELTNKLAISIRNQLDQELLYNLRIMNGWHGAIISHQQLDEVIDWVDKNTVGEYRWCDNRVAFKESKDYEWFMLRWS